VVGFTILDRSLGHELPWDIDVSARSAER